MAKHIVRRLPRIPTLRSPPLTPDRSCVRSLTQVLTPVTLGTELMVVYRPMARLKMASIVAFCSMYGAAAINGDPVRHSRTPETARIMSTILPVAVQVPSLSTGGTPSFSQSALRTRPANPLYRPKPESFSLPRFISSWPGPPFGLPGSNILKPSPYPGTD